MMQNEDKAIMDTTGEKDPDYHLFMNAIKSSEPVKWLVKNGRPSKYPGLYKRNNALEFLTWFKKTYPDVKTEIPIEDIIEHEQRLDYEKYKRVTQMKGESMGILVCAASYFMRLDEAKQYVYKLKAQYGPLKNRIEQMTLFLNDIYFAGCNAGYNAALAQLRTMNLSHKDEEPEYFEKTKR